MTPDKNSAEKMSTMHLLGSEIIQTPSMAPHDDSDNYMNVAKRIVDEDPNAISLNQVISSDRFNNINNIGFLPFMKYVRE